MKNILLFTVLVVPLHIYRGSCEVFKPFRDNLDSSDPYHWMGQFEEFQKAHESFGRRYIDQKRSFAEKTVKITELAEETDRQNTIPRKYGPGYFYNFNLSLVMKEAWESEQEKVIFTGGKYLASISNDGNYIAHCPSYLEDPTENKTLRIRDVNSNLDLENEEIQDACYNTVDWLSGSKGFFYFNRRDKVIKFHTLHENSNRDVTISQKFGNDVTYLITEGEEYLLVEVKDDRLIQEFFYAKIPTTFAHSASSLNFHRFTTNYYISLKYTKVKRVKTNQPDLLYISRSNPGKGDQVMLLNITGSGLQSMAPTETPRECNENGDECTLTHVCFVGSEKLVLLYSHWFRYLQIMELHHLDRLNKNSKPIVQLLRTSYDVINDIQCFNNEIIFKEESVLNPISKIYRIQFDFSKTDLKGENGFKIEEFQYVSLAAPLKELMQTNYVNSEEEVYIGNGKSINIYVSKPDKPNLPTQDAPTLVLFLGVNRVLETPNSFTRIINGIQVIPYLGFNTVRFLSDESYRDQSIESLYIIMEHLIKVYTTSSKILVIPNYEYSRLLSIAVFKRPELFGAVPMQANDLSFEDIPTCRYNGNYNPTCVNATSRAALLRDSPTYLIRQENFFGKRLPALIFYTTSSKREKIRLFKFIAELQYQNQTIPIILEERRGSYNPWGLSGEIIAFAVQKLKIYVQ